MRFDCGWRAEIERRLVATGFHYRGDCRRWVDGTGFQLATQHLPALGYEAVYTMPTATRLVTTGFPVVSNRSFDYGPRWAVPLVMLLPLPDVEAVAQAPVELVTALDTARALAPTTEQYVAYARGLLACARG